MGKSHPRNLVTHRARDLVTQREIPEPESAVDQRVAWLRAPEIPAGRGPSRGEIASNSRDFGRATRGRVGRGEGPRSSRRWRIGRPRPVGWIACWRRGIRAGDRSAAAPGCGDQRRTGPCNAGNWTAGTNRPRAGRRRRSAADGSRGKLRKKTEKKEEKLAPGIQEDAAKKTHAVVDFKPSGSDEFQNDADIDCH